MTGQVSSPLSPPELSGPVARILSEHRPLGAGPREDLLGRALTITLRALEQQSPEPATRRLTEYYRFDSDSVGLSFLDGSESVAVDSITASDLHAVTMLGLGIGPRLTRQLLCETSAAARIAACLDPGRLPVDASLDEADPALRRAMSDLHDSVYAALELAGTSATTAPLVVAALCARKRPQLFPIRDPRVCRLLGLSPDCDRRVHWQLFTHLVREHTVVDGLAAAIAAVHRSDDKVRNDPYPLHHLHALLRTFSDSRAGRIGDIPMENDPRWHRCSD